MKFEDENALNAAFNDKVNELCSASWVLWLLLTLVLFLSPAMPDLDDNLQDADDGASHQRKGFFKIEPGESTFTSSLSGRDDLDVISRLGQSTYEEPRTSALLGLFLYSGLMFTVPLITFFLVKHIMEDEFNVSAPWNLYVPVLSAVVAVNAVIAAYVFKAFREDRKERESRKAKKVN